MAHNLEVFLQAGFQILDLLHATTGIPRRDSCHKNEENPVEVEMHKNWDPVTFDNDYALLFLDGIFYYRNCFFYFNDCF